MCEGPDEISIHALLAESDPFHFANHGTLEISIHALLAESDTSLPTRGGRETPRFLSTLSLRRATVKCHKKQFLFCS